MGNRAEANLSALFESTDDLIWSVDLDYRLIAFNRALRTSIFDKFGAQVKPGMRLEEVLPAEKAALWPPMYARALAEGHYRAEYPMLDGRTLEVAFAPIVVDGETTGISVFGKDITERKRSDQALRASLDSLREAQTAGSLGSYVLDIPGEAWTGSDVLEGIFGIDKEYDHTVAGWTALVHPDDRAMAVAYFEEVVRSGKAFNKEYRIVRQSDQAERWVLGMGKLVFDSQGKPLKMFGIIKDITERKRAEMQLRESEERYRSTFEQAAVGIVHASFEGSFLRCNPRFAEIVGYLQEEIPGMAFHQVMLPEDEPENEAIRRRIANGDASASTWEKRYRRKDGSLTWVRVTVSAQRDAMGRPLHSIALVEDINDRKAAEERLAAVQEALRASEERYRTVFETSVDGMALSHLSDGRYVDVNKAFLDLMGFDREEVIGRTSVDLNLWTEPEVRRKLVDELRRNSFFRDTETRFIRKNGEPIWLLLSGSAIEIEGIPCILSVMRDISAAKAAEEGLAKAQVAVRASEERYRLVFQTSPDFVTIARLNDGTYIDANQAFFDATGFKAKEVIGRTSLEINFWADPRDREGFVQILRQNSNCRNLEARFRKKNGEIFSGLMSASVMELDGVPCILCITRDISEAKAAEDKIRSLAFYDSLTGLPNRRLLMERLRQTLASSMRNPRQQALLLVGMDNFKTLNETLGHQTGDLLLQTAARRLNTCLGEDGPAARLSGDEFLVVLEDLSGSAEEAAARAQATAEKIIATIGQPYLLGGRAVSSTASIGITFFGDRPVTANEILQQADIALDQSKTAGRNTVRFFAPALQTAVNARAALEDDLRQGIAINQFVLYYQPQVDRNRLIGAEALIRWNHPARGLLAPGEFIPLAEETGLILPLGNWVLETACAQIAAFAGRAETAHIAISVNISARQFRQPNFVHLVLAALDRTGANPRNLELELTESMLVEDIEDVIAKMTALKVHGLRFSLDDFGTGYSSLAYLRRLPLDQLKIDRSFVRDILMDSSSGAIAQTILSLSSAMGLPVIAEGVETEEQRAFLTGLGCHSFQGYLFSRPLPLMEFERLWLNSAKSAAPILQ
jgi:diguanylate cyclase (GGDEF)-like protein/PAS domain S-box-containing protein